MVYAIAWRFAKSLGDAMAKRLRKSKPLRTLPIALQQLANAPMEVIAARAQGAASLGVSVFDAISARKFVSSGRLTAPMGTRITITKKGVTIRQAVSRRALSIRDLHVSPGLAMSTTGANRHRVTAEGKRGLVIEVPRGFVWNNTIFMRDQTGRKIASAKNFLIKSGADPSPAAMLGVAAGDVLAAETAELLRGLDDVKRTNS